MFALVNGKITLTCESCGAAVHVGQTPEDVISVNVGQIRAYHGGRCAEGAVQFRRDARECSIAEALRELCASVGLNDL